LNSYVKQQTASFCVPPNTVSSSPQSVVLVLMQAPVIIGAVGGSGTRVVARIVRHAGFFIGSNLNESEDALDFVEFYDRWINRYIRSRAEPLLREEASRMNAEFESCLMRHRSGITEPSKLWGWKEPRSIYLLPFFHAHFLQMKFIQVVRDGRDMAFSGNQNQLRKHGCAVLEPELNAAPQPVRTAALWSAVNLTAAAYAEAHLGASYLAVRFESLCADPNLVVERIFSFLGAPRTSVASAIDEITPPATIERWKLTRDQSLLDAISNQARVALQKFGYG